MAYFNELMLFLTYFMKLEDRSIIKQCSWVYAAIFYEIFFNAYMNDEECLYLEVLTKEDS